MRVWDTYQHGVSRFLTLLTCTGTDLRVFLEEQTLARRSGRRANREGGGGGTPS
jgi:hypothetical protein